jgi:hypothetical protein
MGDPSLVGVVLGWLLGVLSTPLVMYCQAIVERRRFKDVLKEELREVRFRLAVSVHVLKSHLGKIDRASLEKTAAEMEIYTETPERNRMLAAIREMLALNDVQLAAALATQPRNPLGTKTAPRVVVPYLSAKMDSIGLLCPKKQKELVNLIHYVEAINFKAIELSDWNSLTFEVTNNENHALAAGNADVSIQAIADAAERAVACIKNYFE